MLERIQPITALVEEMLDQLPKAVFTSKTTTFLDPCMGGGQFVTAIERRLREHGHSDANIAKRVYGVEDNEFLHDVAVNTHALVGNYYVDKNYLEYEETMKFDVVIGNPPYQTSNGEKGGARSLWRKFVKKAFTVADTDGIVAFVCPGFPWQSLDLGQYFTENTPLYLNNDGSEHFPTIGSDIKIWVVQRGLHNKPFYVDGTKLTQSFEKQDPTVDPIVSSIFTKIEKHELFECMQDRGYSSTQLKNDATDYFDKPKGKSIYPIRHASNVKVCYVKAPTECHNKKKVMMTFSGYPNFEYYDSTTPMSSCYQMSGYILVSSKREANALIKLYSSKLYRFLSNGVRAAGFRSVTNYSLPKVDLTRPWTDEELYKYFKLTKKEIEYIENAVK